MNLTMLYRKKEAAALGEAMLSYRNFHIPGIDMLCDWRELTTANEYRLTRTGIWYLLILHGFLPRLIYNLKNNPDYIILTIVMNFTE